MKIRYFNHRPSSGFIALFCGRMLQFAANGLLGLFLPIYLLQQMENQTELVFYYYLIGYLLYFLLLPIGARMLNKIGLRRSIRASVFFEILFYVSLLQLSQNPVLFIPLSILFLTIDRLLFWIPFHTDFAKFTEKNDRGKEVSLLWATRSLLRVVMPVMAGWLIVEYGFSVIFVIVIMLLFSINLPFLFLPRTKERFSWKVKETFQRFLDKKNQGLVLANIANGMENAAGVVIWPIFIFGTLKGDYLQVGAVSSAIILVVILLQLLVGKYVDKLNKRHLLRWGSAFNALGWFIKIFVFSAFQIFIAGTYHGLARIFKDTPFDSLNYELMADKGHLVDEYTVLKEMAISFGRALMLFVAVLFIVSPGIAWSFALAAIASVFINVL